MTEDVFVLPPRLWRHICDLLGEPADTERDPAEMLVEAVRDHPLGHDCPKCIAYRTGS